MKVKLNLDIYSMYQTLMLEAKNFMDQTGQDQVYLGTLADLIPETVYEAACHRFGSEAIITR